VTTPAINVLVASELVPSLNVTVPVGVPLVLVTVALNVTDWPNTVGFVEELRVVVLPNLLIVSVSAVEVFVLKLPSPL
jgi:hypothetical protein